jgi:Icc-related predicted phosphoesterase
MRLLFLTDVHGSSAVLKKAVGLANKHRPDALLVGADLLGKGIVEVVDYGDGTYSCPWAYQSYGRFSKEAIAEIENAAAESGMYVLVGTEKELYKIKNDSELMWSAIVDAGTRRLSEWAKYLHDEAADKMTVIWTPGNDDPQRIDKAMVSLEKKYGIVYPLRKAVRVGDYEIVSLDYCLPTPWNTPRELPEEKLGTMISMEIGRLADTSMGILNFHQPPYNTKTDVLDKGFLMGGETHIGSRALRAAIEKTRPPIPLVVCGHIHESDGIDMLGSTTVVNPGSGYQGGVLRAAIINLERGAPTDVKLVEV